MESHGLRHRLKPDDEIPLRSNLHGTLPADDDDDEVRPPPIYTVDLSVPPAHRYDHIVPDFRAQIRSLPQLFDEIITDLHRRIPLKLVRAVARFALRRVHSAEETEELRGIAHATGVDMYLLVAFNVLLDMFMGCTSGGVRVRSPRASAASSSRMLHFRTLDWGMDALRKVIVQLDFVARADGPVMASSVTYLGFVGVLTGVRPQLSVSLNFRAVHNSMAWFATARLYTHQLLVLLGLRPPIASLLRQCLLPAEGRGHRWQSLAEIEADMPRDYCSAVVASSEEFIVTLNHDVGSEPPADQITSRRTRRAIETTTSPDPMSTDDTTMAVTGMADIVAFSLERKRCVVDLWHRCSKRTRKMVAGYSTVTEEEVQRWMDVDDIVGVETHYAVIMDPTAGRFVWVRRYPQPADDLDDQSD